MTITRCPTCERPLLSAMDHDNGCPFTLSALVTQFGSEGTAAGAVAIDVVQVPAPAAMKWPEAFRWLVLHKQQHTILGLAALGAGTSTQRLQAIFRDGARRHGRHW